MNIKIFLFIGYAVSTWYTLLFFLKYFKDQLEEMDITIGDLICAIGISICPFVNTLVAFCVFVYSVYIAISSNLGEWYCNMNVKVSNFLRKILYM